MGLFSWKCAVSGKSIAVAGGETPSKQSSCVLVTPDAIFHERAYEGYGVFCEQDVYALLGDGDRDKGIDSYYGSAEPKFKIKIVLKEYFRGQSYDELPESEECEYQGYFYPSDDDE